MFESYDNFDVNGITLSCAFELGRKAGWNDCLSFLGRIQELHKPVILQIRDMLLDMMDKGVDLDSVASQVVSEKVQDNIKRIRLLLQGVSPDVLEAGG